MRHSDVYYTYTLQEEEAQPASTPLTAQLVRH